MDLHVSRRTDRGRDCPCPLKSLQTAPERNSAFDTRRAVAPASPGHNRIGVGQPRSKTPRGKYFPGYWAYSPFGFSAGEAWLQASSAPLSLNELTSLLDFGDPQGGPHGTKRLHLNTRYSIVSTFFFAVEFIATDIFLGKTPRQTNSHAASDLCHVSSRACNGSNPKLDSLKMSYRISSDLRLRTASN